MEIRLDDYPYLKDKYENEEIPFFKDLFQSCRDKYNVDVSIVQKINYKPM